MDENKDILKKLIERMKIKYDLDDKEVFGVLGKDRSYMSQILQGKRKLPKKLIKTVSEFITEKGKKYFLEKYLRDFFYDSMGEPRLHVSTKTESWERMIFDEIRYDVLPTLFRLVDEWENKNMENKNEN